MVFTIYIFEHENFHFHLLFSKYSWQLTTNVPFIFSKHILVLILSSFHLFSHVTFFHLFPPPPKKPSLLLAATAQSRCWKVPKLQVARARQRGSGFGHGLAFGNLSGLIGKGKCLEIILCYSLVELSWLGWLSWVRLVGLVRKSFVPVPSSSSKWSF